MSTTAKTQTKACADCIHWNEVESGSGECRRHAPQMIAFEVDEDVRVESHFPMTATDDWCGDFEAK